MQIKRLKIIVLLFSIFFELCLTAEMFYVSKQLKGWRLVGAELVSRSPDAYHSIENLVWESGFLKGVMLMICTMCFLQMAYKYFFDDLKKEDFLFYLFVSGVPLVAVMQET